MESGHLEVRALVGDGVHPGRVGVDAAFGVGDHRALLPASLPELVADLQVFPGQGITLLVMGLLLEADIVRAARQVGSDDVPAGTATGEVVQGAHAPGERIGMLEGHRGGDVETQVPGGRGHGRHQSQRSFSGTCAVLRRACSGPPW